MWKKISSHKCYENGIHLTSQVGLFTWSAVRGNSFSEDGKKEKFFLPLFPAIPKLKQCTSTIFLTNLQRGMKKLIKYFLRKNKMFHRSNVGTFSTHNSSHHFVILTYNCPKLHRRFKLMLFIKIIGSICITTIWYQGDRKSERTYLWDFKSSTNFHRNSIQNPWEVSWKNMRWNQIRPVKEKEMDNFDEGHKQITIHLLMSLHNLSWIVFFFFWNELLRP